MGAATARAYMCTPILYLRNHWTDYTEIRCAGKCYTTRGAKHVQSQVTLHVRTCTPLFYISETTVPVKLKFGVRVIATPQMVPSMCNVRSLCTCARASLFVKSHKPRDQLNRDLVCRSMLHHKGCLACPRSGHSARAHVHPCFLYLINHWTNYTEIWCACQYYTTSGAKHVQRQFILHVRTCTPSSISHKPLNQLNRDLVCGSMLNHKMCQTCLRPRPLCTCARAILGSL